MRRVLGQSRCISESGSICLANLLVTCMMHVMSGTFNYKFEKPSKLNGKRQGARRVECSYVTQEPWIYTTSRSSGQQLNFGSGSRGRGFVA
jgi:hypothetical protein